MREILGITGDIKHGKSTFARHMQQINPNAHVHYETGEYVTKFGDAFNTVYKDLPADDDIKRINQTFEQLDSNFNQLFPASVVRANKLLLDHSAIEVHPGQEESDLSKWLHNLHSDPTLVEQPIAAGDKDLYRPFLQWLGNHFVTRVHPNIWFREIFKDVQKNGTDKELILVGGVRYPRDATFVRSNGTGTIGKIIEIERPGLVSDTTSPSEIRRREIKADVRIINNGTEADLGELCLRFYDDLRNGTLEPAYRTINPLKKAA